MNQKVREKFSIYESELNKRYREDLWQLKGRINFELDRMTTCSIDTWEGFLEVFRTFQSVKDSVEEFSRAYLNPENRSIDKMNFQIKVTKNHKEKGIIGGNWTHLALKDEQSYAIGTFGGGIKVFEKAAEIFSGCLSEFISTPRNAVKDMIYVKDCNCYMIAGNKKLYRKDVNGEPPYPYLNLDCGFREGACLRYSKVNRRLFVNKDWNRIAAISLGKRVVELEVEKSVGKSIVDFRLVNKEENLVAAATYDRFLILYGFNFEKKFGGVWSYVQVEMKPRAMATCPEKGYILLQCAQSDDVHSKSRMIVFVWENGVLEKRAEIENSSKIERFGYALECLRIFKNKILWLELSGSFNGIAHVYEYEEEAMRLKELYSKMEIHLEKDPVRIIPWHGAKFFFTGKNGSIVFLRFGI